MDSTTVCSPADKRARDSQSHVGVKSSRNEGPRASAAALLHQLYGPIAGPLQEIESLFCRELQSSHGSLASVLSHGTQLGGKRLRPAMLLLSGAAVGPLTQDHVVLGTVIEMVHTATLVHDDVLDEAETRRHVPTVNHRWNDHTSILLGDYLFAQSFRLAATLPSTEACRMIGEAARRVCEGELRQVLLRDALDLDEETYLSMLGGKTGELCRVACQLGAKASCGNDDVIEALGNYGAAVGIAFQIADDFLDLWGNDDTVGKTLGTDIGQGKMTLPMIRFLQTASPHVRREVIGILQGPVDGRLRKVLPLLNQSDAKAYTLAVAERFQQQAFAALDRLVPSEARDSLTAIGRFAIDRRF